MPPSGSHVLNCALSIRLISASVASNPQGLKPIDVDTIYDDFYRLFVQEHDISPVTILMQWSDPETYKAVIERVSCQDCSPLGKKIVKQDCQFSVAKVIHHIQNAFFNKNIFKGNGDLTNNI